MSQFHEQCDRLRQEVWAMEAGGRFHEAVAAQHTLVHLLQGHLGARDGSTLSAMLSLGYLNRRSGCFAAALYWYERILEHGLPVLGEGHNTIAITYNNLGSMMYRWGQYDKPLAFYHKAISHQLRYGGYTCDVVSHFTSLASAWRGKGDFIVAAGLYSIAPWLRQHESWLVSASTMMSSCFRLGQILSCASHSEEEAERWVIRAGDYVRAADQYDPLADEALAAEAEFWARRGNFARIPTIRHRLTDMTNRLGPEHPEVGHMHLVLGRLLLIAGHPEQAQDALTTALHVISASLGKEHILYWMTLTSMARLHLSRGANTLAESLLYDCIEDMQAVVGISHPWLAEPMDLLAAVPSVSSDARQSDYLRSQAVSLTTLPRSIDDFPSLARYCLRRGFYLESLIFSHAAHRRSTHEGKGLAQVAALECRGMASAALGWTCEAIGVFDDAAAMCVELGNRPRLALCLSRYANALAPLLPNDPRITNLRKQARKVRTMSTIDGSAYS